jgi:DNA-binding CsgD family transcriptional regulator
MTDNLDIKQIYFTLLNSTKFDENDLDYSIVEKHIHTSNIISQLGNSGVSIFDLHRKQHLFYSFNFAEIIGYKLEDIKTNGQDFIDDKIHPNDKLTLFENGISALKLFNNFSADEKKNYKLINEYRILNAQNEYVRLIEQHQALELDKIGNLWLSISIIDFSPNQESFDGVNSQLLNFRTGKVVPFQNDNAKPIIKLTAREKEILNLVKQGLLSKEISETLSISVHTVNTHRQRFLEKLQAKNSMEAVIFATKLGLLE